ncbi:hypothetical protein [Vibrio maerlii]|uniref:hypothetical protein n=1 Tax=Vibrio maerlii TaxID=2231648 RepID=UPI000E3E08E3|nr:hypothetical protein [Vibrio maerlii]
MSDTDKQTQTNSKPSMIGKLAMLIILAVLSVGVMGYAGKAAIGNLYVLSLKSEIKGVESLVQEGIAPSVVDARQLTESVLAWDGDTPSTLTYVASFARWFDHLLSQSESAQPDSVVGNSSEWIEQAIQRRPTMSNQYLLKAIALWQQGKPKADIAQQYQLAQQFGPYEKDVALASLEFYLAYWPQLNTEEKVLASQYLLSPRDYRLGYREIGRVIQRSPNKHRACSLLSFNNIKIRECKS